MIGEHRILSTYFLVHACQHLWHVLIHEVYQQFSSLLHTPIARSQPRDARRIERLSQVSLMWATLSPGSRPRIAGLYDASQASEPLTAQRVESHCSTAQHTASCHSAKNEEPGTAPRDKYGTPCNHETYSKATSFNWPGGSWSPPFLLLAPCILQYILF